MDHKHKVSLRNDSYLTIKHSLQESDPTLQGQRLETSQLQQVTQREPHLPAVQGPARPHLREL